jgi:SulP family sulfate permease
VAFVRSSKRSSFFKGVFMSTVLNELRNDLFSPRLVSILSIGLVMGVLLVILEISFAAMLFTGDLGAYAIPGAGITLFGALVMSAFMALSSSFKSVVALPQDAPVAVLATVGVAVAAAMPAAPGEARFMTIVALLGISSLSTALTFVMIGRFRLANLLRYMPYPVVGGFLAGSGWLLTAGSISVMCGITPGLDTLSQLASPAALWKWVPGVAYGGGLFLVMKRWSHFSLLPGSMLLCAAAFFLAFFLADYSLVDARQAGFLLSGIPSHGLWPAFSLSDLAFIDWGIAVDQLPAITTVVLVTVVMQLLNISGIELASGTEIDINHEFTAAGIANTLSGISGCHPGTPALSLSTLAFKLAGGTRLVGLTAAMVVAAVLFLGGGALEFIPKPLLGGLLLLLGLSFMDDWLVAMWHKLPKSDYGIVFSIFLFISLVGFLEGVCFGLVLTVFFFVVRFSRVSVVQEVFTARDCQSKKRRSIPHRTMLASGGERIRGYRLNGYIFFGSATTLGLRLREALDREPGPLCILLDFENVTGFDISAVNQLQRFIAVARSKETRIVFSTTSPWLQRNLERNLPAEDMQNVHLAKDLDHGLEWAEELLLDEYAARLGREKGARATLFEGAVDAALDHLDRQAAFEELVERLEPWAQQESHCAGAPIFRAGDVIAGLRLLTWGHATERSPEGHTRLRACDPGAVFYAKAAFVPQTATTEVVADVDCRSVFLPSQQVAHLSRDEPALALALQRHLILRG